MESRLRPNFFDKGVGDAERTLMPSLSDKGAGDLAGRLRRRLRDDETRSFASVGTLQNLAKGVGSSNSVGHCMKEDNGAASSHGREG